ncbi:hypothetical protein H0H92_001734 [Tricholoma furcatifolium]|nr:hypothetical protein H0H92_001734 [Tricholoma furcatifolium]
MTNSPLATGYEGAIIEGPEAISMDDFDAEFEKLDNQASSSRDGDRLPVTVNLEDVYDLSELDNIRNGTVAVTVEEQVSQLGEDEESSEWDAEALLQSLGVK